MDRPPLVTPYLVFLALMAAGVVAVLVTPETVEYRTLPPAGSAVAGAGAGLLFKAALGAAIATAQSGATAGVLAVFFVIAYLGLGLPPILLAAAGQAVNDRVAIIAFSVGVIAVAAIATRLQAAALRRPQPGGTVLRRSVPQMGDI